MDEANIYFIAGVVGTTAVGVTLVSWYVMRSKKMNARPTALRPRTDDDDDESTAVRKNKSFTIENPHLGYRISSDDEMMLFLNETRQSITTLVNGYAFSENKRDHDLTEIKLRISILEDELQKKLQTNVYFERMANSILLFEKKLEELQTGERMEMSSTKYKPQQFAATSPPAPPPTPTPPPSPPILRQRSTTAVLQQQHNYSRMKISAEDLQKVKLKPLQRRRQ